MEHHVLSVSFSVFKNVRSLFIHKHVLSVMQKATAGNLLFSPHVKLGLFMGFLCSVL